MELLKRRLFQAMSLTDDFYNQLNENFIGLKISNAPSNTIGEQAYCIVGARESYLKALQMEQWMGFSCNLVEPHMKGSITGKLKETHHNIVIYLQESRSNDENDHLLFELLEHEVQHHGQLIRYTYANKIQFPKSWVVRYSL